MVLPSKMGIPKAYEERTQVGLCLSVVVFEKLVISLLWCVFGLILYPSKDWLFLVMTASVMDSFWGCCSLVSLLYCSLQLVKLTLQKSAPKLVACSWVNDYFWVTKSTTKITSTSVLIWFYLLQIWFYPQPQSVDAILANLALSPLAIQQACCH